MEKIQNNLETFVNMHISILNQILFSLNGLNNMPEKKYLENQISNNKELENSARINCEFIQSLCDEFGLEYISEPK